MHISQLARLIIAVAATAITAIAGLAVGTPQAKAQERAMPQVRTLEIGARDIIVLNTFNCTPATHGGINNPETITHVQNKCPTRVWLHGHHGETYCTSPNTLGFFDFQFVVANLQVSSNRNPCP